MESTKIDGYIELLKEASPSAPYTPINLQDRGIDFIVHFLYERNNEIINASDLAKHLNVSLPRITKLLDTGLKRGIIKLDIDPRDKRKKIVTLTDKGVKMHEEIKNKKRIIFANMVEAIGEDDFLEFVRISKKMKEYFSSLDFEKVGE